MLNSTTLNELLAGLFVPLGIFGAGVAVVCALLALVAFARGAAGLSGGAVGGWTVGAMLSVAAGFAGAWMPLAIAAAALVIALVAGALTRAMVVVATR